MTTWRYHKRHRLARRHHRARPGFESLEDRLAPSLAGIEPVVFDDMAAEPSTDAEAPWWEGGIEVVADTSIEDVAEPWVFEETAIDVLPLDDSAVVDDADLLFFTVGTGPEAALAESAVDEVFTTAGALDQASSGSANLPGGMLAAVVEAAFAQATSAALLPIAPPPIAPDIAESLAATRSETRAPSTFALTSHLFGVGGPAEEPGAPAWLHTAHWAPAPVVEPMAEPPAMSENPAPEPEPGQQRPLMEVNLRQPADTSAETCEAAVVAELHRAAAPVPVFSTAPVRGGWAATLLLWCLLLLAPCRVVGLTSLARRWFPRQRLQWIAGPPGQRPTGDEACEADEASAFFLCAWAWHPKVRFFNRRSIKLRLQRLDFLVAIAGAPLYTEPTSTPPNHRPPFQRSLS